MLNWLIQFSLRQRTLILAIAGLVLVSGYQVGRQLPIEVLPDLTKPTVVILTEAPGLAPEEVETLVTMPLESALMGVSGLTRLRTTSDVALSLIYVEFDWGADIYRARQLTMERLRSVESQLPEGIMPYVTPVASLMGEIALIGIRSLNHQTPPQDIRTMADWTIKRRIQNIAGIADVLAMGGGVKQIHIQPRPERMRSLGISLEEITHAATEAASNTSGGFLSQGSQEIMVRNLGMTTDLSSIASTLIQKSDDRTITIGDVANVVWGIQPMRGDAAINGQRGVILSVTKSPGVDTLTLTSQLEAAIEELNQTLPEDIELVTLFRQADFIEHAVSNLSEAIRDGGLMVVIILFLFLLNPKTTLITLTAIPLSFATTTLVFHWLEVSVNSMTLGGLAVAIGMVVDDAIIDVENVFRRLSENAQGEHPRHWREVIANASSEVRSSILYATLLIVLVFVPLLGLTGLAGRLFTPIAVATITSMVASFVVSLTVIPVLCSLFLKTRKNTARRESYVVTALKKAFKATWLRVALDYPRLLFVIVAALLGFGLSLYPNLGKEFLPTFQEDTLLVAMTAAPGTSLSQTTELADMADKVLMSIPEVKTVGRRLGRAEHGDHVVPVSTVEFDIDLQPSERSRSEVKEAIREKMRTIPGTFSALGGPLADRIGHMLSGVPAKIAIKVFGPDLEKIRSIGTQIQAIAHDIPGLETAKIEQQATIPQLRLKVDRERARSYGVTPGALNNQLSTLLGGRIIGALYEGQRTIDLVIRMPETWRNSQEAIEDLYVTAESGEQIPLRVIANLRHAKGPNLILRENTVRRFVVSINPTQRDLKSLVSTLQERVNSELSLPENYYLSFEGEYLAQQEASTRIAWLSLVVLGLIAVILHHHFQSKFLTAQVIMDLPLALLGGLIATKLLINNISISTLVGFIAVAGIAARNSVMLLSNYLYLMRVEGLSFSRDMIERGTLERLVPVMMTALTAGLALLPLIIAADEPGKEILFPVATVILGGLATSTFLGLGVTPAVFYHFAKRPALHAVARSKKPKEEKSI